MKELVGVVVFSGFMAVLVALLVGHVLLSIYRERRQRRAGGEAPAGQTEE
jgi:hypothetical protein